jgi:Membrane-associating domain
MVSKVVDLGLRGLQVYKMSNRSSLKQSLTALQFLWTLIVISLVGNIIADAYAGNPSIINYDMFVAVFAMLSLCFLIASAFTGVMSGTPIPLALDILNTLFYFCGAVAMSAQLGVHRCSNEVGYSPPSPHSLYHLLSQAQD